MSEFELATKLDIDEATGRVDAPLVAKGWGVIECIHRRGKKERIFGKRTADENSIKLRTVHETREAALDQEKDLNGREGVVEFRNPDDPSSGVIYTPNFGIMPVSLVDSELEFTRVDNYQFDLYRRRLGDSAVRV